MPNGPSYRAHPRLYLNGQFIRAQVCPLSDKSGQTVDFGGGWFVR
jgi:hypothetical protein